MASEKMVPPPASSAIFLIDSDIVSLCETGRTLSLSLDALLKDTAEAYVALNDEHVFCARFLCADCCSKACRSAAYNYNVINLCHFHIPLLILQNR